MNIETSCFRAFQAASEVLNFTEAARLIGMTQSGVSQHIAKLEKEVGAELFFRVGKKVILTNEGKALLDFIEKYQDQIILLKDKIQESTSTLKGRISYAMPATCLLSPHFSQFLDYRKSNFPDIEVSVDLNTTEEVVKRVLTAEIDFGFVTKKIINDELEYQFFCEEEYVLVSSSKIPAKHVFKQDWIYYPGSEVLTEAWIHSQKIPKKSPKLSIKIGSRTNSIHAALTMVAQEVGIAIMPRHCIEATDLRAKLKIHDLGNKLCKNTIYIVSLKNSSKPRRVVQTVEAFFKIKN